MNASWSDPQTAVWAVWAMHQEGFMQKAFQGGTTGPTGRAGRPCLGTTQRYQSSVKSSGSW